MRDSICWISTQGGPERRLPLLAPWLVTACPKAKGTTLHFLRGAHPVAPVPPLRLPSAPLLPGPRGLSDISEFLDLLRASWNVSLAQAF